MEVCCQHRFASNLSALRLAVDYLPPTFITIPTLFYHSSVFFALSSSASSQGFPRTECLALFAVWGRYSLSGTALFSFAVFHQIQRKLLSCILFRTFPKPLLCRSGAHVYSLGSHPQMRETRAQLIQIVVLSLCIYSACNAANYATPLGRNLNPSMVFLPCFRSLPLSYPVIGCSCRVPWAYAFWRNP